MSWGEKVERGCDYGILGLVLSILVFGPLATGAVRPQDFLVIELLTAGAIGLWLVRIWISRSYRLLWPPVVWGLVLAAAYGLIRYAAAPLEYVARQECLRGLVYGCLFLVVLNQLHRKEYVRIYRLVLVFLGMGIAAYAIYQFATESAKVWHFVKPSQYLGRGSGTYICPNHLAGFLGMVLPLGLTLVFQGREGAVMRLLVGYACLVMLAGIAVSLSRGGWLATGVAFVFWLGFTVRRRAYWLPAVLVVALVGAGGHVFLTHSIQAQKRLNVGQAAAGREITDVRQRLYHSAARMWKDHFWLGVGPGHFDHCFPTYRPVEVQARPGRVHNDYLNLLVDWGAVGGAIVLVSLGLVGAGLWRTWRYVGRQGDDLGARESNRAGFVLGATTSLVALGVHSFTDFNLHVPANALVAVTLVALLASQLRYTSNRYWVRLGWLSKVLFTALLMVAGVCLGRQAWRQYREQGWLERAHREKRVTRPRIEALEQAHAVEPTNFETTYHLGECWRKLSWQGEENYREQAEKAMVWYRRGIGLNPFDAYNYARLGMCLDWVGRHEEALSCYEEMLRRDGNNYYLLNLAGWHYVQVEDWTRAREYFIQSGHINGWSSLTTQRYLDLIRRRSAAPAVTPPSSGRR